MLNWRGDELKKKMDRVIPWAINSILADCVREAKARVPKDMTVLQGSIQMRTARKSGNNWIGIWGTWNCKYAIFVEKGTAPHVPPIGPLKDWAARKLGDERAAYAVRHKIALQGTKPQPFLLPAADKHFPRLKRKIKEGMAT